GSLDNPHYFYGYVYYQNGTGVPAGTVVTLTDDNNGNSITTTTIDLGGGVTNFYMADVSQITNSQDGDLIIVNCTCNNQVGENSTNINVSMGSQQVDVHLEPLTPPSISNPYPTNASTNIDPSPTCHVDVSDSDGNTLTVYFYENTTGSWVLRQTNSSVSSGSTVYWTYAQANNYGTTYWWKVAVNDSVNNVSEIYHFTTTVDSTPPTVTWESPTPADGAAVNNDWVYLNTTITDATNTSAFFDWNNSLVGYWSFDYYNSTHVFDNSTYGNDGTFQGTNFGVNNITTGKFGKALSFDGVDDYVEVPDSVSLRITGDLTIETWIYPKNIAQGRQGIVFKHYNYEYEVIMEPSGKISFYHGDGTWEEIQEPAGMVVTENQWNHVVITRIMSPKRIYFYLNGIYKGYDDYTDTPAPSSNPVIIGERTVSNYNFNGTIDEVRIYNRALSPEEINASYNNGLYRLYHNFTGLGDGEYNYSAYVIDSAGNLNKTSMRSVTVDTTPPTSNVNTITPYRQTSSPLTITATASDDLSGVKNINLYYRYSSDNNTWNNWINFGTDSVSPWNWSFNFPDGAGYYEFYSIARDNATNVESAPSEADTKCLYDNPPSISNPYPANGSTDVELQPTCHIDVSDADGDSIDVYWYENSTGSWILRQTNSTPYSYGSEYVFNPASTDDISVSHLNGSQLVVAYKDNEDYRIYSATGNVSDGEITFGSEYRCSDFVGYSPSISPLNSSCFIIAYGMANKGCVKIGTVSGNSISYSSRYVFTTNQTFEISVSCLDSSHFVVAYRDDGNSNYGTAVVGTVSGSSISFGDEYVFNSARTEEVFISALDSTHFVVAYKDYGNSQYGTARIGTVSGSSISFGDEYVFNSAGIHHISVSALDSSHFVVSYQDYGNSFYGTARIGTVSGSSISFGDEYVFNSAGTYYTSVSALDSSHFVVTYKDVGNSDYG
ncbi:MAG: hypothetical protein DRM98_05350, partial [Thermoplasmata archaeon]